MGKSGYHLVFSEDKSVSNKLTVHFATIWDAGLSQLTL